MNGINSWQVNNSDFSPNNYLISHDTSGETPETYTDSSLSETKLDISTDSGHSSSYNIECSSNWYVLNLLTDFKRLLEHRESSLKQSVNYGHQQFISSKANTRHDLNCMIEKFLKKVNCLDFDHFIYILEETRKEYNEKFLRGEDIRCTIFAFIDKICILNNELLHTVHPSPDSFGMDLKLIKDTFRHFRLLNPNFDYSAEKEQFNECISQLFESGISLVRMIQDFITSGCDMNLNVNIYHSDLEGHSKIDHDTLNPKQFNTLKGNFLRRNSKNYRAERLREAAEKNNLNTNNITSPSQHSKFNHEPCVSGHTNRHIECKAPFDSHSPSICHVENYYDAKCIYNITNNYSLPAQNPLVKHQSQSTTSNNISTGLPNNFSSENNPRKGQPKQCEKPLNYNPGENFISEQHRDQYNVTENHQESPYQETNKNKVRSRNKVLTMECMKNFINKDAHPVVEFQININDEDSQTRISNNISTMLDNNLSNAETPTSSLEDVRYHQFSYKDLPGHLNAHAMAVSNEMPTFEQERSNTKIKNTQNSPSNRESTIKSTEHLTAISDISINDQDAMVSEIKQCEEENFSKEQKKHSIGLQTNETGTKTHTDNQCSNKNLKCDIACEDCNLEKGEESESKFLTTAKTSKIITLFGLIGLISFLIFTIAILLKKSDEQSPG